MHFECLEHSKVEIPNTYLAFQKWQATGLLQGETSGVSYRKPLNHAETSVDKSVHQPAQAFYHHDWGWACACGRGWRGDKVQTSEPVCPDCGRPRPVPTHGKHEYFVVWE